MVRDSACRDFDLSNPLARSPEYWHVVYETCDITGYCPWGFDSSHDHLH
jgi:hypothetical protein